MLGGTIHLNITILFTSYWRQVFALYHSHDPHNPAGLYLYFYSYEIVLVFLWRYLILIQCNNGKRKKYGHGDGCTILILCTDDGFTLWWRWLHQFRWVSFDTHTAKLLQTNTHIGCIIVVNCHTCQILGAFAQLDCIVKSFVGNVGNRHSRSLNKTHSLKKKAYFNHFIVNSKLIHGQSDTMNSSYSWVPNVVNVVTVTIWKPHIQTSKEWARFCQACSWYIPSS